MTNVHLLLLSIHLGITGGLELRDLLPEHCHVLLFAPPEVLADDLRVPDNLLALLPATRVALNLTNNAQDPATLARVTESTKLTCLLVVVMREGCRRAELGTGRPTAGGAVDGAVDVLD